MLLILKLSKATCLRRFLCKVSTFRFVAEFDVGTVVLLAEPDLLNSWAKIGGLMVLWSFGATKLRGFQERKAKAEARDECWEENQALICAY